MVVLCRLYYNFFFFSKPEPLVFPWENSHSSMCAISQGLHSFWCTIYFWLSAVNCNTCDKYICLKEKNRRHEAWCLQTSSSRFTVSLGVAGNYWFALLISVLLYYSPMVMYLLLFLKSEWNEICIALNTMMCVVKKKNCASHFRAENILNAEWVVYCIQFDLFFTLKGIKYDK